MALANSAIQEVDGMKSLAIGSHHHHHNENPNNGNLMFRNTTTSYQLEQQQQQQQQIIMSSLSSSSSRSLINFKCGINFRKNNHESNFLSFEPQGICTQDTYNWDDDHHDDQQQRLMDDPNCFQTATNNYHTTPPKDHTKNEDHHHHHAGSVYEWLYSQATDNDVSDAIQDPQAAHHQIIIANHKRCHMGESSGGVCKKQCTAAAKKQKPKSATAKDPQSIAAKNRRERISERLKILQELVPNGSKVDLVTMLEKAISYVKFLQLQVKILATDEFWPVQGGKAPDISQVKEAIDVILSSQRERSSSSNSEK